MLLDPHSLEFGVMIHISARRALPIAAKARKAMPKVEEEGVALLLTIIADIDSRFPLLVYYRSHGLPPSTLDRTLIDRLPDRT
jgi:hypothetical protein